MTGNCNIAAKDKNHVSQTLSSQPYDMVWNGTYTYSVNIQKKFKVCFIPKFVLHVLFPQESLQVIIVN